VYFGASGVQNMNTIFLMLGWARCASYKKRVGARYAKLVFLHSLRSVGHVACLGVQGAKHRHTIVFMLGWARCRYHEIWSETHYAEPVFLHSG
jgi:hypothetical protein